ncbi:MAG TPA: hypothetical protein VK993_01300 [Chthoniobacterales bacterium]|nr:hypothetical protein [Chthoniobacterales bacterium]
MTRIARKIATFVRRTETLPLLVITAACLFCKEFYPLSHFPMYSSFASRTHYVYLADGNGRPLPTFPTAGMNTPALKKVYDHALREERTRIKSLGNTDAAGGASEVAAERVLRTVQGSPAARTAGTTPQVLRMYRVDIELVTHRFEKRTTLLAEVR